MYPQNYCLIILSINLIILYIIIGHITNYKYIYFQVPKRIKPKLETTFILNNLNIMMMSSFTKFYSQLAHLYLYIDLIFWFISQLLNHNYIMNYNFSLSHLPIQRVGYQERNKLIEEGRTRNKVKACQEIKYHQPFERLERRKKFQFILTEKYIKD